MAPKVTPKQIWEELEKAGASSVQAAGIMGNAIAESGLNPELTSPGVGLWQWLPADYPQVPMPTGHPVADMQAQVKFLTSTGGLKAASGTTVAETACNFSARYERCSGCQAGGSSNQQRQSNAQTVAGWASKGDWPATAAGASDNATLTSAQVKQQKQAQQECLWAIGWGSLNPISWLEGLFGFGSSGSSGSGELCLFSKSQARAIAGMVLLGAGGVLMLTGVNWMVLAAAGPKILQVAGAALGPEAAAPGKALAGRFRAGRNPEPVRSQGRDSGT